jgi:hypothetical protein
MKHPGVTSWRILTSYAAVRLGTKRDEKRQVYCNAMGLFDEGGRRGGSLTERYRLFGDPRARLSGNPGGITNPFNQLRHNNSYNHVGGKILRGE